MITKTNNEIIDGVLKECVAIPGKFWELSSLIRLSIDDKKGAEDIYALRGVVEMIVEGEGLLTKYGAGWCANNKTHEIVNIGGYIKYISRQQEKNELQEEADEARNRTAILQWKRINWAFGFSITAILIALASFVVTICK